VVEQLVEAMLYKQEVCTFVFDGVYEILIDLIPPALHGPGVDTESNRNEYHGGKSDRCVKGDNLAAIMCRLSKIVYRYSFTFPLPEEKRPRDGVKYLH
jgi:hypothetical protein